MSCLSKHSWGLLLLLLLSLQHQQGFAQALPSNVESIPKPGALLEYDKKTLEPDKPASAEVRPATKPQIDVSQQEAQKIPESQTRQMMLNEVAVTGVTVLTDEEIATVLEPYVGKMTDMKTLVELKDKITALYLDRGYLTTRAYLPAQKVTDGKVQIAVEEGRIEDVEIKGLKHLSPKYIRRRLTTQSNSIFQVQPLEKDLMLLNQSGLVTLRANIAPGSTSGTSDIILTAEEPKPWHLSVFSDNQGRENLSFYRAGMTLNNTNLLGYGDALTINALGSLSHWDTEGSQSLFASYSVPMGIKGAKIGIDTSAGHSDVGGTFGALDITGRASNIGLFTSVPLWYNKHQALVWDARLNSRRSMQFLGDTRFSELGIPNTEVRSVETGLTWSLQGRRSQTTVQGHVTQGFRAFGGNQAFQRLNVELNRVQSLGRGIVAIGRFEAQLSPNELPSLEQFQLGGGQSVRGYREGMLSGDQGYLASLEVRVPAYFLPARWERDLQFLGFIEAGAASSNNDSSANVGNIRSLGVGVRANIKYLGALRLDVGLSQADNLDEPTARIHLGLSNTLF